MLSRISNVARLLGACFASSLVLCLPAIWNGFPLLYPDSIEYMNVGGAVVQRLLGGVDYPFYGQRSVVYSAFVYLCGAPASVFQVCVAQGMMLAYPVLCVLRVFGLVAPGPLARADALRLLVVSVLLTLATSAGIYVALILADIFTGIMILTLIALAADRGELSSSTRCLLALELVVAVSTHLSNIPLAVGVVVPTLIVMRWKSLPSVFSWKKAAWLLGPVVAGFFLLTAMTSALYGSASGPRPLFLLARAIGDGPGLLYLQEQCDTQDFAVCRYLPQALGNSDNFLWGAKGVMAAATVEDRKLIRQEELEVVFQAVRAHPFLQLRASLENIARQLIWSGYSDLTGDYVRLQLASQPRGYLSQFLDSKQARHYDFLGSTSTVHGLAFGLAVLLLLAAVVVLKKNPSEGDTRLYWLTAFVLTAFILNASVTGVTAGFAPRFQTRITWLVPLVALLLSVAAIERLRRNG